MHRNVRLLALPIALVAIASLAIGATLARPDRPDADAPRAEQRDQLGSGPTVVLVEEEGEEADESKAANTERIVELLSDAGIETDATTFEALAAELGVGGAVRALAWADALADGDEPLSAEEIAELRAEMGWGRIRKELDPSGELGLHPGIGWIMRGADADEDAGGEAGGRHAQGQGAGHGRPDDPGAHGRARAAEAREKGGGD